VAYFIWATLYTGNLVQMGGRWCFEAKVMPAYCPVYWLSSSMGRLALETWIYFEVPNQKHIR